MTDPSRQTYGFPRSPCAGAGRRFTTAKSPA
jgi:hypothetical protein